MLKDSLYTIQKIAAENGVVDASITLNTEHEIFKGHFPGEPVLPGVCMVQITKEILETAIDKQLQLHKAADIKFLQIIRPGDGELLFSIQYNSEENDAVKITSSITVNNVVCNKMKAAFSKMQLPV